jgi:hypothetical protein
MLFYSCGQQNASEEKRHIEKQFSISKIIEDTLSDKNDYEFAEKFLNNLKSAKVDTIIFYNRTCINCCDFYNIFWSEKGQKYLTKIYFDFDDKKSHSKTISLTTNKIFETLGKNYLELKNTSIKENLHKQEDGTYSGILIDHYCYSQISIYTNHDSIITDRIKDHSFYKYLGFELTVTDNIDKSETNDNYNFNYNSKWNFFLTTIENEISKMTITSKRELENLRPILSDEKNYR